MKLGVQHIMRNPSKFQRFAKHLGNLNGSCTHKNRTALVSQFRDSVYNGVELVFPCLVDEVLLVFSDNRLVGRNGYYIQLVD